MLEFTYLSLDVTNTCTEYSGENYMRNGKYSSQTRLIFSKQTSIVPEATSDPLLPENIAIPSVSQQQFASSTRSVFPVTPVNLNSSSIGQHSVLRRCLSTWNWNEHICKHRCQGFDGGVMPGMSQGEMCPCCQGQHPAVVLSLTRLALRFSACCGTPIHCIPWCDLYPSPPQRGALDSNVCRKSSLKPLQSVQVSMA